MPWLTDDHSSKAIVGLLLVLMGATCNPPKADLDTDDDTTVIEGNPEAQAIILESHGGVSHVAVAGVHDDFGEYLALGETTFVLGPSDEVLRAGTGIAVLQAGNGDQIVAELTCQETIQGINVTFHWRDSVTFSTGSVATNTGAFINQRPPGLNLSKIRARRFNDTTTVCQYCCCRNCGDTSCRYTCGYICCGPASGGPLPGDCSTQTRTKPIIADTSRSQHAVGSGAGSGEQVLLLRAPAGDSYFATTGHSAEFGHYLALGELLLMPALQEGDFFEGAGLAVLQAENDDQIVADVSSAVAEDGVHLTFHWRDEVTFSTGSTVATTGQFVSQKPPGLTLSRIRGRMFDRDPIHCRRCFIVQNCVNDLCDVSCELCCSVSPSIPPGCF